MQNILEDIHIILYVKNQQESKNFYKNLFNITPVLDLEGMTEFTLLSNLKLGIMPESSIVKIFKNKLPHPSSGNNIPRCELYLKVNNPLEYQTKAIELGAKLISELSLRDWGDEVSYLSDLDGHILAFVKS